MTHKLNNMKHMQIKDLNISPQNLKNKKFRKFTNYKSN